MTACWTCSVDAFRRAFRPAARRTTYPKSCGLGRAIPCSIAAEQRHKIIGNRLALVAEESVSGVTAEPPPGQSGAPAEHLIMPTDSALTPRTVTRNAGSRLWMISAAGGGSQLRT